MRHAIVLRVLLLGALGYCRAVHVLVLAYYLASAALCACGGRTMRIQHLVHDFSFLILTIGFLSSLRVLLADVDQFARRHLRVIRLSIV